MATVYLLHFSRRFQGARHYTGYTARAYRLRLREHGTRRGARLLYQAKRAGVTWIVARAWTFRTSHAGRKMERQVKRRKATTFCPLCRAC